ncbi:MAG: nickel pincer cofactor biosynthesis protein LarC [Gemmatimonadota bacterium]
MSREREGLAAGAGAGAAGGGDAFQLVLDPFSGISGDMVLGCWMELGLDRDWLLGVANAVGLEGVEIRVDRVERAGVGATKVTIQPEEAESVHRGRYFREIRELIANSGLHSRTKELSLGAFRRLAEAEGKVHGVAAEDVHFHEVGAIDAILDICGAADGFVRLNIETASSFPVALGRGWVEIQHGRYPVPAPATAYLLEGIAVYPAGYSYEVVTPTGAALLAELCGGRSPSGDMRIQRIGYGAGSADPEDHPNCLRACLTIPACDPHDCVIVLQADIDDMTPEYVPGVIEACLQAGALDATISPVHMKKGRPGWRLEAQVAPGHRDAVEEAMFAASTTLGIRSWRIQRRTLPRTVEVRTWRGHRIRIKRSGFGPEGGPIRAKPEFDDVAEAARREGWDAARVLRRLRALWPDLA